MKKAAIGGGPGDREWTERDLGENEFYGHIHRRGYQDQTHSNCEDNHDSSFGKLLNLNSAWHNFLQRDDWL